MFAQLLAPFRLTKGDATQTHRILLNFYRQVPLAATDLFWLFSQAHTARTKYGPPVLLTKRRKLFELAQGLQGQMAERYLRIDIEAVLQIVFGRVIGNILAKRLTKLFNLFVVDFESSRLCMTAPRNSKVSAMLQGFEQIDTARRTCRSDGGFILHVLVER